MPRPSNTDERRQQIVGGLLRAMAERGYQRASIKQIAREAGVASGIVHYHFGSKQQILVALVDDLAERVRHRYHEAVEAGSSPRDRLFALLDAHLALGDGADARAVAAWVVVGAEAVGQPEVREVYARQLHETAAELEKLLSLWMIEEGRDPSAARAGAGALLAAIEGAYQLSAAAPGLLEKGSAAPSMKRLATALVG